MTPNAWIGLDIGGANIKAATTSGFAKQLALPLWKAPERLAEHLAQLLSNAPARTHVAVTMTGELADCFATKAEGVRHIIESVEHAIGGRQARYYDLRHRGFVDASRGRDDWRGLAASNWAALAAACGRVADHSGLLVDVGSTTTDIVGFDQHGPATQSLTDTDRLLAGELLYQGVGRTPAAALVETLPVAGIACPVAAELFATSADAAVLLGRVPESEEPGADGRPLSKQCAAARLARMVCADPDELSPENIKVIAEQLLSVLAGRLSTSLSKAIKRLAPPRVVVSGAGEWLAYQALDACGWKGPVERLSALIGQPASVCAPAWAVALLAETGADDAA